MIIDFDTLKELINEKKTIRRILKDYCITYKLDKISDIIVSGDTVGLQYRVRFKTEMWSDLVRAYKKQMLRRYRLLCQVIKSSLKEIDKEV